MTEMIRKSRTIFNLYIRKYTYAMIGVFIMVILITIFGFTENLLNQYLLDEIVSAHRYERLGMFACTYLGINVVCMLLSFCVGRQNLNISQKCSIDMRMDLMSHIHQKDMSKINKCKTSEFLTRLMDDVTIVGGFFNNTIVGNVSTSLAIFIMMGYLLFYSWPIAVAVLGLSTLQIVVACFFSKTLKKNQEDIRHVTQEHMGQLDDNIANLPLIKSYMLGKHMLSNYKQILISIKKISLKNYDVEYLLTSMTTLLSILCDFFVIFVGVNGIKNGTISVGAFVVILNVSVTIRGLFKTLAESNVYFQRFFVSLNRVFDIINMKEDAYSKTFLPDQNRALADLVYPQIHFIQEISFQEVVFSYDTDNIVLNGFDMTLQSGRLNVLRGESGAGKSTILALLLQLYQPTAGKILVNGRNVPDAKFLRNEVSICFQTDYFVRGSIYDNLKIVNPLRTDEEINYILQLVEAEEFIKRLSQGLNGSIKEISNNFSGGEIKRISLARTLLKDAQVYVFDESFTNIDAQMRARIFKNIVTYLESKIILVVTHDLSLMDGYDTNLITA